jgi:hypothetical protein
MLNLTLHLTPYRSGTFSSIMAQSAVQLRRALALRTSSCNSSNDHLCGWQTVWLGSRYSETPGSRSIEIPATLERESGSHSRPVP